MTQIIGTSGIDTLGGTTGADEILGLDGDDTLSGGEGNDTLDGGEGSDSMAGGEGDDVYHVDSEYDVVVEAAGEGDDEIVSSAAYFVLPDHVERLTGTSSAYQQLMGNALDNVIAGGSGWNFIEADDGDDSVIHSAGGDGVGGGNGWDTYVLPGGAADYEFSRDDGAVQILDLATFEITYLWGMEAVAFAGDNSSVTFDALFNRYGTSGDDILTGDGSSNLIYGYAGDDTLVGGAGQDWLDGGLGADSMSGGDGEDFYFVDDSGDSIVEAEWGGFDIAWVNLTTYTVPDYVEVVVGTSSANSSFTGNDCDNSISTDAGDDSLFGGAGSDWLASGAGDDVLAGGSGVDGVYGGSGADVFVFGEGDSGTGSAADWIEDFVSGEDVIDLSAIDADEGIAGDQAFVFVGSAAFTSAAGELRIGTDGVGTWLEGDTDGDGTADFQIMLRDAAPPLASDFVL